MKRLPPHAGEWIDRTRPVAFTFEGRAYRGFAGDTIASALAAAGVRTLGRSFKYHRPRGLLSAANHDVNALLQVEHDGRSRPNVRGDVEAVRAGMRVRAVNTFGGLAGDRARWLDRLSAVLPVGFYYKAFHHKRLFPFWERMFRRLTGLGEVALDAPLVRTPKRYAFCDVLVIGAGPAGVAAALAAADAGADVLLADEWPRIGGSGICAAAAGDPAAERFAAMLARAAGHPNLRVLTSTFAAGYYADHWVALAGPAAMTKVRARAVVIAQGAFEQPAVFRNNDLPGVMLASGARLLMHRYAVAPCRRAAILTANAHGYEAALDALEHGIEVAAVLDLRRELPPRSRELAARLARRAVPLAHGAAVYSARAGFDGVLAGIEHGPIDGHGRIDTARLHTIEADGLWMSVGFAPANALLHQAGARLRYDPTLHQFVPAALPDGVFACGRVNGVYGLEEKLDDGARAGTAAAGGVRGAPSPEPSRPAVPECPNHPYPIFAHPRGRDFVDFDEDLQLKDLHNAAQEGFDSIELLKRFSTVGMGPSQGKHANLNAVRILARLRGEPVEAVGGTTARPPFHPVPLALLAGRGFTVERTTAVDAEHERAGAVWMEAGQWRRPEYYAIAGKSRDECIAGEVHAVRNAVGLIDVGTLGKIDVHGPDAALLIERVYTGRFANLGVGRTRYGLMCDETGVVIDDGVIARLAERHFYFTTTTGGSANVYRELTRLNSMWQLDAGIVNATGHLAAFNLAGPHAREVLRALTPLDLAAAAFPYLGARLAAVAGVPARLLRVGFVGELGYEIHVPADGAVHVWRALLAAGAARGIRAFGVEAQRLLRLEKGHIIVGQDSDGLSTPFDLGCEWALKLDKPFFVGGRSLQILARKDRPQRLVGFEVTDPAAPRPRESHLVIEDGAIAGRVTSCAWSPTLGKVIGLAFVAPALAARGRFSIRADGGALVSAAVVPTPFYDADNARQSLAESL